MEVTIRDDSPSRYDYSAMNDDNAPLMISNPPAGDPVVQSRPESPSFGEQHESVSNTPRNDPRSDNNSQEKARSNRNRREPKYIRLCEIYERNISLIVLCTV